MKISDIDTSVHATFSGYRARFFSRMLCYFPLDTPDPRNVHMLETSMVLTWGNGTTVTLDYHDAICFDQMAVGYPVDGLSSDVSTPLGMKLFIDEQLLGADPHVAIIDRLKAQLHGDNYAQNGQEILAAGDQIREVMAGGKTARRVNVCRGSNEESFDIIHVRDRDGVLLDVLDIPSSGGRDQRTSVLASHGHVGVTWEMS